MDTLISHEIPKALFNKHHLINDYPYILGHLLVEGTKYYDEVYASFYAQKIKEYEYSIMDNGLWELGDSIDYKTLYEIGEKYKPSHLILPDCLNERKITTERTIKYLAEFEKISTPKFIGVIQGKTLEDLILMTEFYNAIDSVEVIAIPLLSLPISSPDINTEQYSYHRINVTRNILKVTKKPIHLLGCITPHEFRHYNQTDLINVKSIDTSAPIMYGLEGIKLNTKEELIKGKTKLVDVMDLPLTFEQENIIAYNIRYFRKNLYL